MNSEKQYSIINPKDNTEIFFDDLKEETSDGDSIEYIIRNYPTAHNDFYKKYSIFNPREKTAWDHLDVEMQEKIKDNFTTEVINVYVFSFDDNEYYINNKPYTYYEFHNKKRKISNF